MKKIWVKDVSQEVIDYLRRLSFEYENYKDNLCYLLSTYRNDSSLFESSNFKKYQELAVTRFAEYEIAKEEASKKLLTEGFSNENISWEIDFQRSEMRLTLYSEKDCAEAEKCGFEEVEE